MLRKGYPSHPRVLELEYLIKCSLVSYLGHALFFLLFVERMSTNPSPLVFCLFPPLSEKKRNGASLLSQIYGTIVNRSLFLSIS